MLKSPPALWKVKAEAKAEKKNVVSSLNLDLNLSLVHLLRTIEVPSCQNGFFATYLVPESTENVSFTPATSIWSPSFRSCCPTTSVPLTRRDFAP